jgi:flagellar hook-associated protein FlgK
MGSVTANTLSVARQMLEQDSDNLNRLNVVGARELKATMKSSFVGSNGTLQSSLSLARGTDPLLENAQRKQITELEGTNAITSYLREFQSVISGGQNSQESILVESVNEFFSQAKILESNSGSAMRQAFIGKGEVLARRVSEASSKGVTLQLEVDNQMKESVGGVNSTLKALFDFNQQIRISQVPIKLHDSRDNLVNELVKFMDIKVTYESGGSVLVQSKKDGMVLVSGENYAKIDYPGILSREKILSGNDHPPMTMTHYGIDNKKAREPVVMMGGSDDLTQTFSGGQWGALVDLRKNILPTIINAAKTVGRNIATAVNKIHNDGSTFPLKSRFESGVSFYGVESLDWKPLTIHAISKDGDQLRGGFGVINPITIDMSKFSTTKADGNATVSEMIKEINAALDTGPSRERAAIGSIKDGSGAQISGQYLVNNMQLKAGSTVSGPNNSFTFELDFQGNSHFGSKIEVMSVVTSGGYNVPTDQLKDSFRLEKGVNESTGLPITVDNINAPQTITVEVRVTGDNGVVQRGTITYAINPATVALNDRIAIDLTTAAQNGDFVDPNTLSGFSSIARAMLVDENGIEIDMQAYPGATGKLVIQTADDSYRLAIQGGLSQTFQFNNMFNFDEFTGELKVNPKIVEDVNQLAIGRAAKDEGVNTVHVVGDAKATATLNFAGIIANGDTVTAGGQTFSFVAALAIPSNPNEVLTGSGVLGLRDAINNHPDISGLVTASISGGNVLTLTANNAGTAANTIAVATNLAAATVDLNGGGANGINAGNLQNGTDKFETSKVYSYIIKSKSGEVLEAMSNLQFDLVDIDSSGLIPATKMSLSNLVTVFTGILSDKLNASEIRSGIATNVLEQMHSTLQDKFGIKRDEQYLKAIEDGRLMQALARLISIVNNIETKAQDIIFS